MSTILSFVSPLEFLLRYTVITGVIIAAIGAGLCMMAKKITIAVRKKATFDYKDKLYTTLMVLGLFFILVGMIVMVLPIDATFYVAK